MPQNIKHILPAVLLFTAQAAAWGQTVTVTYSSPGTYPHTLPDCVGSATGHAYGGGGGGGGAYSTFVGVNVGGGGGGGAYDLMSFNTTVNKTFSITVGAGGNGGTNTNSNCATLNGYPGNATTISLSGITLTANGGGGGGGQSGGSSGCGSAGTASTGGLYNGAAGAAGTTSAGGTGGRGGGGAGAGGNANGQTGGSGSGSLPGGGNGGAQIGSATSSNGNPGAVPGGGGSGGRRTLLGGGQSGGRGGDGRAIIVFNFTMPAISGTNTYCEGDALSLSVSACAGASYQWKRNNVNIAGETSSTLAISNLTTSHSGNYTVDVIMSGYTYSGSVAVSGTGIAYNSSNGTFTLTPAISVIVNTPPTISFTSGTQNPTVCQGTAITNTVYTLGGDVSGVSVSNLPAGLNYSTTANTVTIFGTPAASGTYTVSAIGIAPCANAALNGTVTVNLPPTLNLSSGTQSPTVCHAAPITDIVYTFGGSATGVSVTNLPAGLNYSTTSTTVTIFGAPTAGGTYTVSTTGQLSPCPPASLNGTVTINYPPAVGAISLSPTSYCANDALIFPSAPSFSSTPPATDWGWLLDDVLIADPYTLMAADNGKNLKYFVTNACGTGYSNEITITAAVTEIISITPASGPTAGGIYTVNPLSPIDPSGVVTIIGSGFAPFGSPAVTQVSFGGVAATNVTVLANDTLTCTPPPQIASGYVAVSIIAACGTAVLTDGYHYEALNITNVLPDYAPVTGGDTILIKGTGLLAIGSAAGDVWVKLCGVPAEVVSAHNDSIVCITGTSGFSKLDSIEIYNGEESRGFARCFTYYPVTFIVTGVWSEPYNWETQTDDRILPYPGAAIHIKATCLQDIDLVDGEPYPNGKMDSITVHPNKAYTLDNGITLEANVFTLKDNASFLNNGSMQATQQNVEHLLVQGRNWYVASPVQTAVIDDALGQGALGGNLTTDGVVNLSSVAAPSDWRVESYYEWDHQWQRLLLGSNLITGRGYTVFSQNEDIAVRFSGIYNDGNSSSPSLTRHEDGHIKRGFNLVGNPFPSYWRWTEAAASSANLYSTIWYRTNVAGVYEFWSYNASGNVAVAPGWGDATPTGSYSLAYIPPMQAFWVRIQEGQTTGTLNFTNNRRAHADYGSNGLKSGEVQNPETRPLLRMAVSNGLRTDETLLYADPAAKNEFDAYDSDKWFVNQGVEIFTLPASSTRELVINGLPEIAAGTEVILGFQADEGGAFSFRAKEILNLEALDVFLSDKWRNTEFDLRKGDYHFTSTSAPVADRFSIVFRSAANSNLPFTEAGDDLLLAYTGKDRQIRVTLYLRNQPEARASVSVFDITGRKLAEQSIAAGERTTLKGTFPEGVYVLRAGKCAAKVMVK